MWVKTYSSSGNLPLLIVTSGFDEEATQVGEVGLWKGVLVRILNLEMSISDICTILLLFWSLLGDGG